MRSVAQPFYMERKPFAAAAILLAAAIAVICLFSGLKSTQSTFTFAQEKADAQKTIYLTFDDGPSDRVTPKILDVLAEEDVKATFFIIGMQAETRKNILKREAEEGHTVAIHSYTHRYNEIYRSAQSLLNDIDKCGKVIERCTGQRARIYRFPGGSFGLSEGLKSAVKACGLKYVDWNASMCDAENGMTEADSLYTAAINTGADRNRIVMLAHDSTNKSATPEATRKVIKYYKQRGYTFGVFR